MLYFIGYVGFKYMDGEVLNSPKANFTKPFNLKYTYQLPNYVRNEISIWWKDKFIRIE
jgi:hypothetical protein